MLSLKENRELRKYLLSMYRHIKLLDAEAVKKLQEQGFNNPVDMANYCFNAGWGEAVKHLINLTNYENKD
jgi:hypothetical protein